MSVNLKCAACGHQVPFQDGDLTTEAICPGCEVLLRRRGEGDQMAIPVSMALPEQFEPADLGRVPKHSQELIHRYQKSGNLRAVKSGDPLADSNLVLAQAIERLAHAIESGGESPFIPENHAPVPEEGGPQATHNPVALAEAKNGIPVLSEKASNGKTTNVDENGRALPVGAPVLVRREAAAQAHRFQRQTQAATDIKGPRQTAVAKWVDNHPIFMMMSGLTLLIALVVMTTLLMNGWFSTDDENLVPTSAMAGEQLANDPDFSHAEKEARGFLNAIALNPARPYIFRANAIGPKLDRFYEPIPDPANYELELKGRQRTGNRAVYFYHVTSGDATQPLVVLQEDSTFKVFWEFGACVGDISWKSFVEDEPSTPVLMRAFLRPDAIYDSAHPEEVWSSWFAEDWDGSYSARVFAKRGSPEDRRLQAAYQEHPVVRSGTNWVMAQVRLSHLGTAVDGIHGAYESAEVTEVPLGSWLPEEFVSGNTFYSEKDQMKGPTNDLQGLPKRQF
ncbi:hypothetical protein AAFN60_02600 [Roseibacillus persicicus]|uniref:hypothetical protein n=1 Tax=Roseibacillus persicicus TaxID=454148 RepID=UPI00398ACFCD